MDQDENSPWKYKSDGGSSSDEPDSDEPESTSPRKKLPQTVSWEAPEFVEHQHTASWFSALVVITFVLAVIVFLATKGDKVATAIIVILGVIVAVFARQKPGQAKYEISDSGMSVNDKNYKYSDFKSFAIIREGSLTSVNLFPLKRFVPPVSAYFDPKDEKKITETLGNYLPYENRQLDSIDRLSRRLRL